jgi:hypothetical protein
MTLRNTGRYLMVAAVGVAVGVALTKNLIDSRRDATNQESSFINANHVLKIKPSAPLPEELRILPRYEQKRTGQRDPKTGILTLTPTGPLPSQAQMLKVENPRISTFGLADPWSAYKE